MNHEAQFRSWASEARIPQSIVEQIVRHAPRNEDFKDPGEEMVPQIYPLEGVLFYQSREQIDIDALADGFMVIGTCPNGDPIVIDLRDEPGSIWYLSHEEMFGKPLRTVCKKVAADIKEFVSKCGNETFPIDYWAAKADA
jgi:hypothetical protein